MKRSDDGIWTTYRLADGEPIYGEYAWVDDSSYFDDMGEAVEVIVETWQLIDSTTKRLGPLGLCAACQGEQEIDGAMCATCGGSGEEQR